MDYKRILGNSEHRQREMLRAGADVVGLRAVCRECVRAMASRMQRISGLSTITFRQQLRRRGDIIAQIRHMLLLLHRTLINSIISNNLSKTRMSSDMLEMRVANMPHKRFWTGHLQPAYLSIWQEYSGTGFGVFFSTRLGYSIKLPYLQIIIVFLGGRFGRQRTITLISSFIQSFIIEVFIILSVYVGFAEKSGNITGRCSNAPSRNCTRIYEWNQTCFKDHTNWNACIRI